MTSYRQALGVMGEPQPARRAAASPAAPLAGVPRVPLRGRAPSALAVRARPVDGGPAWVQRVERHGGGGLPRRPGGEARSTARSSPTSWSATIRGVALSAEASSASSSWAWARRTTPGAVAASRLRRHGFSAVSEIASTDLFPAPSPRTAVIAISASGESEETLDAVDRYRGRCRVIAMTNAAESTLARAADVAVPMHAGREVGGVACRSYQHTLALLVALEHRLAGV